MWPEALPLTVHKSRTHSSTTSNGNATTTGDVLQLIDNSRLLYQRPECINQQGYFLGKHMAAHQPLVGLKGPSSEGTGTVTSLEGPFGIS